MKKKTETAAPPVDEAQHPFRSVLRAGVPIVAFQTPDPKATIDAQRLRDSQATRNMAREKFAAMRKSLDEMIESKKTRQFDLEDD